MAVQQFFELTELRTGALTEAECRRLLTTRTLGRVGLTSGALPMIMPVEYVYEDGVITFRTEQDSKLRAAVHGAVLAFEVDAYDAAIGRGWSVHVLGRATVLAAAHEMTGPRHYVRLHCELVSGHCLTSSRA